MPSLRWFRHFGPGAGLCAAALLTACGGSSGSSTRAYQATASVGDFLTISVDSGNQTITYANHTNGQAGTVAYTVDADGAYSITTPGGGLLKAYEIPGFALVASADNTGPAASTTSLITAIQQAPVSLDWLKGQTFNYMQWRVTQGGLNVGTVAIDASSNVATTSYWPYGQMQLDLGVGQNASGWSSNNFSAGSFSADPSGHFLSLTEDGSTDTLFATQGGFFVVDNPNGSIISVPQTGTSGFAAGSAGSYRALAFTKTAAMGTGSGLETGTGTVASCAVTVSAAGRFTLQDSAGNTLADQLLQPVAATPALLASGSGQLPNACPGLFTGETTSNHIKQDVYLTFLDQAILFGTYAYDTTQIGSNPSYTYVYGVALKQ
jgi:hypothetical protein